MFNGKSILITGGTGSFGKLYVKTILERFSPKKLIIYSRDELKQFVLKQKYPPDQYPNLRFFIGDVRDGARLRRACEGMDKLVCACAIRKCRGEPRAPLVISRILFQGTNFDHTQGRRYEGQTIPPSR